MTIPVQDRSSGENWKDGILATASRCLANLRADTVKLFLERNSFLMGKVAARLQVISLANMYAKAR